MENVKGMLKVAGQVVEDYESLQIEKNGKTYAGLEGFDPNADDDHHHDDIEEEE